MEPTRDVQGLMHQLMRGQINRRTFVTRVAASGFSASAIGAFLAACGSSTSSTPTSAPATSAAPASAATVAAPTAAAAAPTTVAASASSGGPVTGVPTTIASTKPVKRGGTLKIAMPSDITGLDIQFGTATATLQTLAHMYEYLFTLDEKRNFVPMLAEKLDISSDGKTYTLVVRKGVKFHNDTEMTADDVIASIGRWQRTSSRAKVLLADMDSITATDKYTVTIAFKQPNGALASAMGIPNQQLVVLPKAIIEKNRDASGKDLQIKDKDVIGTGPYRLQEWVPDKSLKLVRFDGYTARTDPTNGLGGKRQANLDSIEFIPVSDDQTRYNGLVSGEYHIAYTLAPALYDQLKANNAIVPYIVKPGSGIVGVFNKKVGPFMQTDNGQKLRQAALFATDPAKVLAGAVDNPIFTRMSPGLAGPEWAFWYNDAGKEIYGKRDLDKAKKLMADAGYKGEEIRWITTKDYDYMYRSALVASEQMKEAGFNVKLLVQDWPTEISNTDKPEAYELFSTGIGFVGDPTGTAAFTPEWSGWNTSARNAANYQALIHETDPTKRKQLFVEQQQIFWEEVPYMRWGDNFSFRAWRKEVQGMSEPSEFFAWNAWLDK